MAIKEENQQSEVAVIRSTVCSFTRGVMIRGSDIDELYIYLHGVDEDRMNYYAVQFAGWFAMGGLNLEASNAYPQLRPYAHLKEVEENSRLQAKSVFQFIKMEA